MLEIDDGKNLMDELWDATSAKVELSDFMKRSFFAARGAAPVFHDNSRSYHRYFMRGKGVLKREKAMLGVYTKDVSRQGIAFLSPVPLLPKESVKLRVRAAELTLEVTRCRRIEAACYDCGGRFILKRD